MDSRGIEQEPSFTYDDVGNRESGKYFVVNNYFDIGTGLWKIFCYIYPCILIHNILTWNVKKTEFNQMKLQIITKLLKMIEYLAKPSTWSVNEIL